MCQRSSALRIALGAILSQLMWVAPPAFAAAASPANPAPPSTADGRPPPSSGAGPRAPMRSAIDPAAVKFLDAWEQRAFKFGGGGVREAEAQLFLSRSSGSSRLEARGVYRYGRREGVTTDSPILRELVQRGWWMRELEGVMRPSGRLPRSVLTRLSLREEGDRTILEVGGAPPYRWLEFTRNGVLAAFVIDPTGAGNVRIEVKHEEHDGIFFLTEYRMRSTLPGIGTVAEEGSLRYARRRTRLEPTNIEFTTERGDQVITAHLELGGWRLDDEAAAVLDATARDVLWTWHLYGYNLARFNVSRVTCRMRQDGRDTHFDSAAAGDGRLGPSELPACPIMPHRPDALARPFPLERLLSECDVQGVRAGERTILTGTWRDGAPIARVEFNDRGLLADLWFEEIDGTLTHVRAIEYRKVTYPSVPMERRPTTERDEETGRSRKLPDAMVFSVGNPLAGMTRYNLPLAWTEVREELDGSRRAVRVTVDYEEKDHLHLPSRVTVRENGRLRSQTEYLDWRVFTLPAAVVPSPSE